MRLRLSCELLVLEDSVKDQVYDCLLIRNRTFSRRPPSLRATRSRVPGRWAWASSRTRIHRSLYPRGSAARPCCTSGMSSISIWLIVSLHFPLQGMSSITLPFFTHPSIFPHIHHLAIFSFLIPFQEESEKKSMCSGC